MVTTITTVVKKIFGHEKGTNFHPGGLAMVNDQAGATYRELVTLPSGETFIPEGRNVILPLPRGSKVLPAGKTKTLMARMELPRYEHGVGIPSDAKFFRDMERAQAASRPTVMSTGNNAELVALLSQLLQQNKEMGEVLKKVAEKNPVFKTEINGREYKSFVADITEAQAAESRLQTAY